MSIFADTWSATRQAALSGLRARESSPQAPIAQGAGVGSVQRWSAGFLAASLVVGGIALTPFAGMPLLPVPGTMPAFGAAMLVTNLLLAALLFGRGAINNQGRAVRLGTAYFFVAVIFVPILATFPGVFVPEQLIGARQSGLWLWCAWHAGFGLGAIRAALGPERPRASVPQSVAATIGIVALLAVVATAGAPYLPSVMTDGHVPFTGLGVTFPPVILAILIAALILVGRSAPSSERLWLCVALIAACFDVWLAFCGTERYSLGWYLSKCGSLITSLAVLISQLHDVTALHHRLAAANETLTTLAQRDGLTSLANRRRFDELIDVEWRRARRDRRPISLAMIDVDHFKAFNDQYGHRQGDACLRQISDVLRSVIKRPADVAARYGGEEFVLVLPDTDAAAAATIAAQVHARLSSLSILHAASPIGTVTVSIGIATMLPVVDVGHESLLGRADDNLYLAKAAGRNRTQTDELLFAPL